MAPFVASVTLYISNVGLVLPKELLKQKKVREGALTQENMVKLMGLVVRKDSITQDVVEILEKKAGDLNDNNNNK